MNDLDILHLSSTGSFGQVALAFGTTGDIVSGKAAAIQRWLIAFMTTVGSSAIDGSYGTGFLRDIAYGVLRTEIDAAHSFYQAAYDALYKTTDETADDADRLVSVTLSDFGVDGTTIKLYITFTTADEETSDVVISAAVDVEV